MKAIKEEYETVVERLETRRLVDRAKGILMDECGMKETEAWNFIQKSAMSERRNMGEIAQRVIDGDVRPEKPA
jgi:response regulator NasT